MTNNFHITKIFLLFSVFLVQISTLYASYAISSAQELLEVLQIKDAQFENSNLQYTTWGDFEEEVIPTWKFPELAQELGIKNEKPKRISFLYNEQLIVRGFDTTFIRKLDPSIVEKEDHSKTRLMPYQKWTNIGGVSREITEDFGSPQQDRIMDIYAGGLPVGIALEQRTEIEFAHGFGFGKRIKEIENITQEEGKTILEGTIQIWWEDISHFKLTLDDNFIVRNAIIESDVKGNMTRFEIETQGTVERKGFVFAESGHFKRISLGQYKDGEEIGKSKIKKEFNLKFTDIKPNLSDEEYRILTQMEITPETYVMDHITQMHYKGNQMPNPVQDVVEDALDNLYSNTNFNTIQTESARNESNSIDHSINSFTEQPS